MSLILLQEMLGHCVISYVPIVENALVYRHIFFIKCFMHIITISLLFKSITYVIFKNIC